MAALTASRAPVASACRPYHLDMAIAGSHTICIMTDIPAITLPLSMLALAVHILPGGSHCSPESVNSVSLQVTFPYIILLSNKPCVSMGTLPSVPGIASLHSPHHQSR